MKTCCHCRKDLPLNSSSITCEKCKRNEHKYGKPTICKYCQLPAAFLEQKCVHCSYSERKHGLPVVCSKCKLKCAFPKNPSLKDKHILCRLCFQRDSIPKSNSPKMCIGLDAASMKRLNSDLFQPSTSAKKSRESMENIGTDVYAAHILVVQQLKDQILELNRCTVMKERIMQEKDKKIAELNAELLRLQKDHRNKISQLQKQNTDMTEPLKEQIKILSKQVKRPSTTRFQAKKPFESLDRAAPEGPKELISTSQFVINRFKIPVGKSIFDAPQKAHTNTKRGEHTKESKETSSA